MVMALLDIGALIVRYGKALALSGVSLKVEPGELVGILGPNGAGKSTLLKAISRTVPSDGTLAFKGEPLGPLAPHEVVARGIAHCPEGRRLFPELSVGKNLMLGAYLRRDRRGIQEDLDRVFGLFPVLRDRSRQMAGTLSGGEQQMVAIGRALMSRPSLLLLDEPSTGLAHKLKTAIFDTIREIRQGGLTVLVVEQDAVSTFRVADRIYVLEHGRVAKEGSAAMLKQDESIRQLYLGVD
jgi:branched-chain amino acid transport system ATP-binding protein